MARKQVKQFNILERQSIKYLFLQDFSRHAKNEQRRQPESVKLMVCPQGFYTGRNISLYHPGPAQNHHPSERDRGRGLLIHFQEYTLDYRETNVYSITGIMQCLELVFMHLAHSTNSTNLLKPFSSSFNKILMVYLRMSN